MADSRDLLALADKLRYDLTAAQAKVTELKRALAELPAPPDPTILSCPHCGPLAQIRSERRLAEHLINVHAEGPADADEASTRLNALFPADEAPQDRFGDDSLPF